MNVVIHCPDSTTSAFREMKLLFPDFNPEDWLQNEEMSFRNGNIQYSNVNLTNQHKCPSAVNETSEGMTLTTH